MRGEGHFLALLRKKAAEPAQGKQKPREDRKPLTSVPAFQKFCADYLKAEFPGPFLFRGEALFQLPPDLPDLAVMRMLRVGLRLGEVKKDRFEPDHTLAMALRAGEAAQTHDLSAGSDAVLAYLRGKALPASGERGWTLVPVDGFPIGWGKASDGLVKNHYPKGLRWVGTGRPE